MQLPCAERSVALTAGRPGRESLLCAFCRSLGDLLAQLFERHTQRTQTHMALPQSPSRGGGGGGGAGDSSLYGGPVAWRFDLLRLLRVAAFAGLLFAPVTKSWFEFLERLYPGSGLVVAVQRMATDQLCYSGVVISAWFLWSGLLEGGGSLRFALAKLRANLWPALKANWMLWPWVQLVNMAVVPLQFRMVVAAIVNIPWTAYLATKAAAKPTVKHTLHCTALHCTALRLEKHCRESVRKQRVLLIICDACSVIQVGASVELCKV